ncbi:uncharacterized protein LAESUDRAFT_759261 [Laetiporus sulphureus 93-53]|uniref:Peroxisomal membrane protein PEX14 n=1 Tax=Laetiporus sulphureus 93-53 TaxID=1314785 RepID=A0A165E7X3_9APHY|nr:uncharacterized protein LAESUDRAFT_759261 [Laetiporus sulphureus 93-53]KZT06413.1 hypothetical protein LAESUDRAFT_759261 [Laetiporus sulphureus 93-53]
MTDIPDAPATPNPNNNSFEVAEEPPQPAVTIPPTDRTELINKARGFLLSPQVRHEDISAKRKFLAEKGLDDAEIDGLLQELPPQVPVVPPRTYPQPPPSNLPNLLIGVARIVSWIAGGSVTLLVIYFRFLYPRVSQTFQACHSLRVHQKDLLSRFTESLESLKATQEETFAVLPRPEPWSDARFGHCQTLDELAKATEDVQDVPEVTLLRCAIADVVSAGKKPTAEELFLSLEAKLPWLKEESAAEYEGRLWETLSTNPLFLREESEGTMTWSYEPPEQPSPPPIVTSLDKLKQAMSAPPHSQTSRFQHTLAALTDLTGYIATQTYAQFRLPNMGYGGGAPPTSTEEDEVKREIRALKGLVLNRRTFMPSLPRPPSFTSPLGARPDNTATP